MEKVLKPISLHEAKAFLDECAEKHEAVSLVALAVDGHKVVMNGWTVTSGNSVGRTHNYRSLSSGEVRKLADILLFEVNGHPVYI